MIIDSDSTKQATPRTATPTLSRTPNLRPIVSSPPLHIEARSSSTLALVLQAAGLYYFDWIDITRPEVLTNDRLRGLFELAEDEVPVTWSHITSRVHPDERPAFERRVLLCFAQQSNLREELHLRIKGDDYMPVEITAVVSQQTPNGPMRLTGSIRVRDVHYQQQVENQKIAERLKLVVKATRVGVWDWTDMTTDHVEFSPCMIDMLGFDTTKFELTLDRFWSLIHKDDVEKIREAVTASQQHNSSFDTEYRLMFANRGYRWVRSMGQISMNPNGTQRLTGAISDIHDQIVMKKRVAKVIEQQQLAVTASASGIWDWRDVNAEAIYMSSGMLDLLGYKEHEVSQTLDGWWELVHLDDRPSAAVALELSLKEGRPFKAEYRMRFADGNHHWIRSTGVPVKNKDGVVTRLTGSITSIAAEVNTRRKLQDQARLYEREFEKLSDRLLASLSDIEAFCGIKLPAATTDVLDAPMFDSIFNDIASNAKRSKVDLNDARQKMNIAQ